MPVTHLLNLRVLADATVDDFVLVRFDGREAMSEPFDYRLEVIGPDSPDIRTWIGKRAEFAVVVADGEERVFSGRIYETARRTSAALSVIVVHVRPAYFALAYGRATHFIQDKSTKDIFEAMTAEVPGLVTELALSPAPAVRGYATRYDESEIDFLARLLAEDGILYFFRYEKSAGSFHHRMFVTNGTSKYFDLAGPIDYKPASDAHGISMLGHAHRALPQGHHHHAFNVNKLDTPWNNKADAALAWARVYPHHDESMGAEVEATADLTARSKLQNEGRDQRAEVVTGASDRPDFAPGGRVSVKNVPGQVPARLVIVSVEHSAWDPSQLGSGGGVPQYSNSFTAIDASKTWRPPVPARRVAPGPLLGVVAQKGKAAGEIIVDDQSRIPVAISEARPYTSPKPLNEIVWLPVQQQWAHSTHGAQFFPRIDTRVVIDFFYGNPDLPFVSGTVYTPSQKYPFDVKSKVTQTGWRSITDKNGKITQEFHFEDKPDKEEIYLYTGRDYRRLIDQDDWGTIKRDQTLEVERDQKETIGRDQTETVKRDRTAKVEGKEKIDVTKTRTITVTDKNLLESKKEIEFKVGASTIVMKPDKIVIKSPQIEITADATLKVSAGAKADYKAPMTQVNADATLILKGGIVLIN